MPETASPTASAYAAYLANVARMRRERWSGPIQNPVSGEWSMLLDGEMVGRGPTPEAAARGERPTDGPVCPGSDGPGRRWAFSAVICPHCRAQLRNAGTRQEPKVPVHHLVRRG